MQESILRDLEEFFDEAQQWISAKRENAALHI
jgi:hypothetical protein